MNANSFATSMYLLDVLLAPTRPKEMWPNSNITHPGNWPVSAVFGIETECFHRDFGNKSSGKRVIYFDSYDALDLWLIEEVLHIRDIDYAYSCHVKVYEWDCGPEFKRTEYLG